MFSFDFLVIDGQPFRKKFLIERFRFYAIYFNSTNPEKISKTTNSSAAVRREKKSR